MSESGPGEQGGGLSIDQSEDSISNIDQSDESVRGGDLAINWILYAHY